MTVRSGSPVVRRKSETLAKRSGQPSALRRCCRIRRRIRHRRRRSNGGMRGPGSSAYGRTTVFHTRLLHLTCKGSFVYGAGPSSCCIPTSTPVKGRPHMGRSRPKDASDMSHPTTAACALSTALRARCVEAGIVAGFADECIGIAAGIVDERAMPITPTSKTRDSP